IVAAVYIYTGAQGANILEVFKSPPDAPYTIWPHEMLRARDWMLYAGPFLAGAAVLMAGRERRRGMDDLLATTPLPAWTRQATTWAATTIWSLLAYLVVAVVIIGITAS